MDFAGVSDIAAMNPALGFAWGRSQPHTNLRLIHFDSGKGRFRQTSAGKAIGLSGTCQVSLAINVRFIESDRPVTLFAIALVFPLL